jgi:hypothetical protein
LSGTSTTEKVGEHIKGITSVLTTFVRLQTFFAVTVIYLPFLWGVVSAREVDI